MNCFTCGSCNIRFANAVLFGRHQWMVHRHDGVESNAATKGTRSTDSHSRQITDNVESIEHHGDRVVSVFQSRVNHGQESQICRQNVHGNTADRVYDFYKSYNDSSAPAFDFCALLHPPISELCDLAKTLISFCCSNQYSRGEIEDHYDLAVCVSNTSLGPGRTDFRKQFVTKGSFLRYVEDWRKLDVARKGWRVAKISSGLHGTNKTGVFRSLKEVIFGELEAAGGISAILPFQETKRNSVRVVSSALDSNSFKRYTEANKQKMPMILFDLYADSAVLSSSGTQSANSVRARLVNVKCASNTWHEVGIAPSLHVDSGLFSAGKLRDARGELFQRFLFLLLAEVIEASRDGAIFEGKLVLLRLNTLVSDQPQERSFFCLKAQGSCMDCSLCTMPTRVQNDDKREAGSAVDDHMENGASRASRRLDSVFSIQAYGVKQSARNVQETVLNQLLVAKAQRKLSDDPESSPVIVRTARKYLKNVSAHELPPALAAIYGLGSEPYHLYHTIGFDRLHVLDLGVARMLPDKAFEVFSSRDYNKNVITKAALVRIVNQRCQDLPRVTGLHISPFWNSASDVHAGMTGNLRRRITPFLWVALMGLCPQTSPDDDTLLQAALALNRMQMRLRGVNEAESSGYRSHEDVKELQQICFTSSLQIAHVLRTSISTKLHRLMYHIEDHFLNFGCGRRGESDAKETLHKTTKACYHATSRRMDSLGRQLLKVRSISEASKNAQKAMDHSSSVSLSYILLSANPPIDNEENLDTSSSEPTAPPFPQQICRELLVEAREISLQLRGKSAEDVTEYLLTQRQVATLDPVWKRKKSVKFTALFPWHTQQEKTSAAHTAYASENANGAGPRYDAVEYNCDGDVRTGFIQLILQRGHHRASAKKFVIVRRLVPVEPDPENRKVVEVFGHTRFSYAMSWGAEEDIVIDCVPSTFLRRIVVVVVDMFHFAKRHTASSPVAAIRDSPEERRYARFFLVQGYQFTSLPERTY